jgi:hypothetical protein
MMFTQFRHLVAGAFSKASTEVKMPEQNIRTTPAATGDGPGQDSLMEV